MSCLILEPDLPAGVTIQQVCKDAVVLATKLDIKIKIEFNDKIIFILPNNNANSLVEAYWDAVKTNSNFVCSFNKI